MKKRPLNPKEIRIWLMFIVITAFDLAIFLFMLFCGLNASVFDKSIVLTCGFIVLFSMPLVSFLFSLVKEIEFRRKKLRDVQNSFDADNAEG